MLPLNSNISSYSLFKITPPNRFNTTLWKNGKGKTTELTISPDDIINSFSYRLSIADVSENGLFSNFSGLQRKLILLRGNGITLTHNKQTVDTLLQPLSFACFDGGSSTFGELINGAIVDFNLMYDATKYSNTLITSINQIEIRLAASNITFIYSPTHPVCIHRLEDDNVKTVDKNHLIELTDIQDNTYKLKAEHIIVIQLNHLTR